MKKRVLIRGVHMKKVIVAFVVMIFLSACFRDNELILEEEREEEKELKILIMNDVENLTLVNQYASQFHDKYPHVTFDV